MTRSSGAQAISLTDFTSQAGAGSVIVEYLEARGIKTSPTLALIAADRDTFVAQVVGPLLDGYKKGAREFSLEDEEKPIAAAVLEHMWSEAAMQWQQRQASVLMATAPLAMPAGSPAPAVGGAASSSSSEKVPKQFFS